MSSPRTITTAEAARKLGVSSARLSSMAAAAGVSPVSTTTTGTRTYTYWRTADIDAVGARVRAAAAAAQAAANPSDSAKLATVLAEIRELKQLVTSLLEHATAPRGDA